RAEVGIDGLGDPTWLFVNRAGRAGLLRALASSVDVVPEPSPKWKLRPGDEIGFSYSINVKSLADTVSKRVDAYQRRREKEDEASVQEGKQKRSNQKKHVLRLGG